MATYGIYGGQYGASTPARKPKASDMFAPNGAQAVAQGAQPTQATPATGAPPPNPFGGAGTNPFGPVAPAANPGSFENLLNKAGPARQQNVQAAQQTVSEQLMPSPAPSRESASARSAFIKAQAEAGRQNAESSSLSGRLLTGQASGDVANFNRESLGQRADLENKLAINDATRADAQRQQGISNLLSMEGLASGERIADKNIASTEKLGFSDLSIKERSLAQAGAQFDKDIDFKKYATDRGFTDAEAQRAWQAIQNDKEISSKEKLGFADLSVREKQLTQDGAQFKDELAFKKYATDRGFTDAEAQRAWQATQNQADIASREKLGFADLSVREKQLAQEGSQFNKELDFKKYATDRGFTDAEAARAWEGIQNDKKIASTEKVAFAGLNVEEKKIAQAGSQFDRKLDFDGWAKNQDLNEADRDRVWKSIEAEKGRVFTSNESAMDRILNQSQFAETIGLSREQFSEQIRQFDSKQDFDKWATQAGLDAQAAELVWKSNEADVDRKFQTGERLSTQEHQVNITRLQGEVDKDKAAFSQALGVQTMEKQAEIDKLAAATADEYQTARDGRMMTHDESMEVMKSSLTAKLEQAGYDHQTAMQAAEIHATAVEKTKDREMATLEAKAELAYKYKALASEEGISKAQIAQRREESNGQLSLGLQQLGLDKTKIEASIKSQDFQDRAGMISTMMEMGGDSADVADKAGSMFMGLLHEKGLISDEDWKNGLAGITSRAPKASAKPDPDKINVPKTGVSAIDDATHAAMDPYNQLSKGNYVTAIKNSVVDATTLPFKALKSLKFW